MTIGNKRAIVSFANKNGNYAKGIARLSDSLRDNFNGDFLGWIGEGSLGCKPHLKDNYSFKIKAMDKAIDLGYRYILWLDASCFAIKNVDPLFELIKRDGILMQNSGHNLGTWTNDKTLDYFGISRDEAMNMPMFGNAGMFGIDMQNPLGIGFYKMYRLSMLNGMFNGAWTNIAKTESQDIRCQGHRHDNSCGSAIANLMHITDLYHAGDKLLQYGGEKDKVLNQTIIIKAQGL